MQLHSLIRLGEVGFETADFHIIICGEFSCESGKAICAPSHKHHTARARCQLPGKLFT